MKRLHGALVSLGFLDLSHKKVKYKLLKIMK